MVAWHTVLVTVARISKKKTIACDKDHSIFISHIVCAGTLIYFQICVNACFALIANILEFQKELLPDQVLDEISEV